jgi:hypothetical protein
VDTEDRALCIWLTLVSSMLEGVPRIINPYKAVIGVKVILQNIQALNCSARAWSWAMQVRCM